MEIEFKQVGEVAYKGAIKWYLSKIELAIFLQEIMLIEKGPSSGIYVPAGTEILANWFPVRSRC